MTVVSVALRRAQTALAAIERATPRLSDDQVARFDARARRDPAEAELWRTAHIALRVVLERVAGSGARCQPVRATRAGRPYLIASERLAQPPVFSISHTLTTSAEAWALIAVARDGVIGVDIEQPRPVRMAQARRIAIEAAAHHLAPHSPLPATAEARFLQAWVRLEAAAKASDEGIGRLLTQAGAVGGTRAAFADTAAARLAVRDLAVAPDVYAAVAAGALPDGVPVTALPDTVAGLEAFAGGA